MKNIYSGLVLLSLFFSAYTSAKEIHWSELSLDKEALAEAPTSNYGILLEVYNNTGNNFFDLKATLELSAAVEDGKLVTIDTMNINGRVGKTFYTTQDDNYLTPANITYQMIRKGKVSLEVNTPIASDGKYTVTVGEQSKHKQYPNDALTITHLMRLLGQMPKEEGTDIIIPLLPDSLKEPFQTVENKENVKLSYQGLKETSYDGSMVQAHVYKLELKDPILYYVDQNKRLILIEQGSGVAITLMSQGKLQELTKDW